MVIVNFWHRLPCLFWLKMAFGLGFRNRFFELSKSELQERAGG
jgi:hypothetical protein